jgi:TolA-binding protein
MLGFQLSTLKKTTTYQPDSKRDNKMRHTRDFFLKGVVLLFLIILFAIMTNAKSLEKDDPDGNDLKKEITKHEHLTNTLCAHVNEQCADALFVLASLYYDQALDRYIKAREEYAKSMDDKGIPPRNKEAVNPIPDYTESMEIYAKLIREYSDFKDIDEAYYQVGTIYLLKGDIDSSRWAFKKVLDKAPESRRASAAHFRLADFSIMEHDYPGAFKQWSISSDI